MNDQRKQLLADLQTLLDGFGTCSEQEETIRRAMQYVRDTATDKHCDWKVVGKEAYTACGRIFDLPFGIAPEGFDAFCYCGGKIKVSEKS